MQFIDIEFIKRSPWWPVKHRPRPSDAEIDRARESGLVTPVVVRRAQESGTAHTQYEIIDNELSWAIAQLSSIHQIPAIVMKIGLLEAKALVETRYLAAFPQSGEESAASDVPKVGPIAIAHRYAEALRRVEASPAIARNRPGRPSTISLVAKKYRTSPALVRQHLNLLVLLPELQRDVANGVIQFGSARLMSNLTEAQQRKLAKLIKQRGYSVRDVEQWLRKRRSGSQEPLIVKTGDPDLKRLERKLTDRLGGIVEIKPGRFGAGRLVVHYHSADHLEGIMSRPIAEPFDAD